MKNDPYFVFNKIQFKGRHKNKKQKKNIFKFYFFFYSDP